jgi:hypothetical protein
MNRCAIGACVLAMSAGCAWGQTFGSVATTRWGISGEALGVGGMVVEDFEDAVLAPGVMVEVTTGNGSYGPTATLPGVFVTAVDPFGTAFLNSHWDGAAGLVNTATNQPRVYTTATNWGDVTFHFDPPVMAVGFSLHQMQLETPVSINGVPVGNLLAQTGMSASSTRLGYALINAAAGVPISTLKLDNTGGDGFVIDHLAFSAVASPSVSIDVNPAWGVADAGLGIESTEVEGFEDTALAPGLMVEWDTPNGDTAPTAVLPNTFAPVTQDPFGNEFELGVWDGSRVVINTRTNQAFPYTTDVGNWGDIVFHFDPPRERVGFAICDMDSDARLIVNGRDCGKIGAATGLPLGARQGYVHVAAGCENEIISSVRFANGRGQGFNDGISFDHVSWSRCQGDFDCSGGVDGDDVIAFFALWDIGDARADVNGDGGVDGDDVIEFFASWDSGC